MRKSCFILVFSFLGLVVQVFSQSFDVRSIFNSGATFGVEHLSPSAVNDSTTFNMVKYKMNFVKVLRTKECDLEDFDTECNDSKANQLFLASKFSWSDPSFTNDNFFRKQFKAELELIYITASKKRGVWFHSVNINAEENNATFPEYLSPNFRVNSVYIHVKNLKFVPFVGPAAAVVQGKFYLLPIFGFGAKLNNNLLAEIIAPVHAKLKYNYKDQAEFEYSIAYSGIHTVYREGNYLSDNDGLNLQQLKTHFGVTKKFAKYYKCKIEFGYAFMQELDAISYDYDYQMSSTPYFNFSFNYNFGNSILYGFFNEEKPKKMK